MSERRSALAFLVLGIGDFFSRLYYHTSFILFVDNRPILVDCPDPLPRIIFEASKKSGVPVDIDDIDNIILTHLHGDHSNGIEGLGFYNHFTRRKKPVIHTIPEVRDVMWENKLKASMSTLTNDNFEKVCELSLHDYFRLRMLYPGKTHSILGMKIKIRYTKHYVPCFGFKVFYKGRSLGYSSDTIFDPEHIDFLSECDVILHETNKIGHTAYEKLLALSPHIREKMLLIHIHDSFNVEKSKIPVAREGKLYYV